MREERLIVRQAEASDVAALVTLNRYVQELHTEQRPDHFKTSSDHAVMDYLVSVLQARDGTIWIALDRDVPIGYLLSRILDRPENTFRLARRLCEIEQIVVAPAARRKGVARRLIERAVLDAESHGVDSVELTSWSFNADAHHAFRAAGFLPMKTRFERLVHKSEKYG